MPAFIPINLTFDGDSSLTQLLPPRIEVLRLCSESNVPDPCSSVGRNISIRCGTLARIKHQQDSTATTENHEKLSPSYYL